MRYLTLTSDSSKYQCSSEGNTVIVQWNGYHDFTSISDIGINSMTFSGYRKTQGHDVMFPVYSPLITRTVTNPKRNILTVRIPKNSSVAQCQLNMGMLNICISIYIHIFRYTRDCCHSSGSNSSVSREHTFESTSVRHNCYFQSA